MPNSSHDFKFPLAGITGAMFYAHTPHSNLFRTSHGAVDHGPMNFEIHAIWDWSFEARLEAEALNGIAVSICLRIITKST